MFFFLLSTSFFKGWMNLPFVPIICRRLHTLFEVFVFFFLENGFPNFFFVRVAYVYLLLEFPANGRVIGAVSALGTRITMTSGLGLSAQLSGAAI